MSESDFEEQGEPIYDFNGGAEDIEQDLEERKSSNPEEAISHAMDNFSTKEANYSISHRLIPIQSFFRPWERRLQEWVGIPQGMTRPLLPDNYFNFYTTFFDNAIKYSASRKGIGRQQIAQVLMAFYSGGQQTMEQVEEVQKTERFHSVRQAYRKARGTDQQ